MQVDSNVVATAIELINNFIELEYNRFYIGEELTQEELENLERAIRFHENITGRKKGYASAIANQLEKI